MVSLFIYLFSYLFIWTPISTEALRGKGDKIRKENQNLFFFNVWNRVKNKNLVRNIKKKIFHATPNVKITIFHLAQKIKKIISAQLETGKKFPLVQKKKLKKSYFLLRLKHEKEKIFTLFHTWSTRKKVIIIILKIYIYIYKTINKN